MIEVYAPGSKVTIGDGITAEVAEVAIKAGGYVYYSLVWWASGERVSEVLEAFEVTAGVAELEIGFRTAR